MNSGPRWNCQETRQLIADLYGADQMLLARESLNSVIDRRSFARIHFQEASKRWEQYLMDIKDCHPFEILVGSGISEIDNLRFERMLELGAHVHACVHSLHTIPDIMARGLYYGLALNKVAPLGERAISVQSVTKAIAGDSTLEDLNGIFKSMYSSGDFPYLQALNNHGKHRSIVQTAIWSDLTGDAEVPISLQFSDFTYDKEKHTGRDILAVLTEEHDRISRSVIDCGVELWNVLKQRKDANALSNVREAFRQQL